MMHRYQLLTFLCISHVVHCFQLPGGGMRRPRASFSSKRNIIANKHPTTRSSSLSSIFKNRANHRRNSDANSNIATTPSRPLHPASSTVRETSTSLKAADVSQHYHKKKKNQILPYKVTRLWQLLYRWITKPRRFSIYVLECEDQKYYIGSTCNMKRRWKEHNSSRGGSKWTRMHRPIRVVKTYKGIPEAYYLGKEAQVTAEYMLKYGINNVRGAMFAEARQYTVLDIPALKGFLGHYNDLSYKGLDFKLQSVLSQGPPKRSKANDRCFRCGQMGHWANECPQYWKKYKKSR